MMRRILCILFFIASAAPLQAQEGPLDEAQLDELIQLGLENLSLLTCENEQPCDPATPDELANPPVGPDEAGLVVVQAIISGAASHCGLDWQRGSYIPMMTYWRNVAKMDERQMALIGVIHGIMQGQVERELAADGACTEDMKAQVQARLVPVQPPSAE